MSRLFDEKNKELQKKLMITKVEKEFGPSYNVAPTTQIPVVMPGSRILTTMRWGLVPFWSKDLSIGSKMINARAETVGVKPSFRTAFKRRRCLIPTSSFFEWDGSKTPHNISLKGEKFMVFAGLWDEWEDKDKKETIQTCTIITTDANSFLKKIHHRMPVILKDKDFETWINPDSSMDDVNALLKPLDSDKFEEYEISREINTPRNNSKDLLNPVRKEDGQRKLF